MKKNLIIFLTGILALGLFTGCGRKNNNPMTTNPTTPLATVEPSQAATTSTTAPTTAMTVPSIEATIEDGNGPIPEQTAQSRIR